MKDNSGKVMLALLAGASAGVIAGLLMAPDTGEQTRTGIKKWASKLSKDLEKNLQAGLDEIKNMSSGSLDNLTQVAKDFADKATGGAGGNTGGGSASNAGTSGGSGSGSNAGGGSSSTGGGSSSTGGGAGAGRGNA